MHIPFLNQRGDNRTPGITWGQRLGEPGCEYLRRWVLNLGKLGSIRVHHWTGSDDDRALHDHPWWFVTIVLQGGYTDVSACTVCGGSGQFHPHLPMGCPPCKGTGRAYEHVRAPAIRFRRALHAHTVKVDCDGAWTLMLCGPVSRDWGFYTSEGWKRMRRYFKDHGHHPCS